MISEAEGPQKVIVQYLVPVELLSKILSSVRSGAFQKFNVYSVPVAWILIENVTKYLFNKFFIWEIFIDNRSIIVSCFIFVLFYLCHKKMKA